jgi:hypothetical protein
VSQLNGSKPANRHSRNRQGEMPSPELRVHLVSGLGAIAHEGSFFNRNRHTETRGTTTVNCTATDAANNKTSCSFTVKVFDCVIVDDTNGKLLRFISTTGEYDFFDCRKRFSLSGRGVVSITLCKAELRDTGPDPQRPDRNLFGASYYPFR